MAMLATSLVALVGLEHFWFMILEMVVRRTLDSPGAPVRAAPGVFVAARKCAPARAAA